MKRYKMFQRDTYVGTYSTDEIYEQYNIKPQTIYSCVFEKKDYNGYYFELEEDLSDLFDEWNNTREMILNAPEKIKVVVYKPFWKNEKPKVKTFKIPIDI